MGKLGDGLLFKYESIIPEAPLDMKFHYWEENEQGEQVLKIHTENFKLITDIEELKTYIEKCKDKRIAFDTETTGLTYGVDKIVGFSISLDRWSGFYVPIRHKVAHTVSEMVDKLDENGNQILTKAGRVSRVKKVTKTYTDYEHNIDPREALDVLYEILTGAKRVIMHNSEFDLNMLKFEGYNVRRIRAFDNLILPYLYDPEATGMAGLKKLERRVLGREVPEFKEVLGKKYENFGELNPEEEGCLIYVVCDTAGLIGVYEEMFPMVKELLGQFKNPLSFDGEEYNVMVKDNQMVTMFVDYYGHCKILIDREKALKYKENLEEEQRKVVKEIYDYFGVGIFNLARSKEFADVMASKKVFTGVKTDKGEPSWSKTALGDMKKNIVKLKECMQHYKEISFVNGVLLKKGWGFTLALLLETYGKEYFKMTSTIDKLTVKGLKSEPLDLKLFWLTVKALYLKENEKVHILELIQKNNSLNKALNSYVDKLTQVDECIMHYRLKGTKSGRLSSGNGSKSEKSKNHYYIDLNAQNLTKPKSGYYRAEQCSKNDPEGILGWKFTPLPDDYALSHLEEEYIVEGQDPNPTIRGCLKAPEGTKKFASIPHENGIEQDIYEIELEDGRKLQCTKDSVFKVKEETGIISFCTLEQIIKLNNVEILED
jgi:DNA polymerase I-like protein with 3'-5' exonuclease and polymerase domains